MVNVCFDERKSIINQGYGRLGDNQSNRDAGSHAAQRWVGEDPQKRQFITELGQSINITELTPEALAHKYQRILTIKANHEAELKKQQQLERLRQNQQSQKIYEDSGVYGAAQPTMLEIQRMHGSHSLAKHIVAFVLDTGSVSQLSENFLPAKQDFAQSWAACCFADGTVSITY